MLNVALYNFKDNTTKQCDLSSSEKREMRLFQCLSSQHLLAQSQQWKHQSSV